MYTQPNSTTLTKQLGPWTQNYQTDYWWSWTINPITQELYHQYNNVWHTYTPEQCNPTKIIYPSLPRMMREAPTNTVLAMPQLIHN